jgi:hypothetical protein
VDGAGSLGGVRVEFGKRERGGSVATITRPDGVRLRLTSYDRKYRVPHDLAHFATERELGLTDGLFGSIAAGALFDSVEVLAGRRAGARSDTVRRRNAAALAFTESLVGVVHLGVDGPDHAVVDGLERAWAAQREGRCPHPPQRRLAAIRSLKDLGARFAALGPAETLDLTFDVRPHR